RVPRGALALRSHLWLAIPPRVRGSCGRNHPVALMRPGDRIGILSQISLRNVDGVPQMEEEPLDIEKESEEVRVYMWRIEQLEKLGVSSVIADAVANVVDWHEVARLVHDGCPPELALAIAR